MDYRAAAEQASKMHEALRQAGFSDLQATIMCGQMLAGLITGR